LILKNILSQIFNKYVLMFQINKGDNNG